VLGIYFSESTPAESPHSEQCIARKRLPYRLGTGKVVCDHDRVGLDIYVGSLTRHLVGDWELVAQKAAREMGLELTVVRKHDPEDAIRDPEQIRPVVLAWREGLSQALRESLTEPLDWNENQEAPYFTDKPTWDCYADLMLWAAYDEQPELSRPSHHVEEWSEDPAYKACTADGFGSRYSHLYDVELWLPNPFGFVFKTEDVGGNPVLVGSSVALFRQLEELNRRTWQAGKNLVEKWAFDGSENGAPLEPGARFAFALFLKLARHSVEQKLPMRLDW
jgi:hypothetical protein